jgi:Holliday junction resolvase
VTVRSYQARNAKRGIAIERRAQADLEAAGYIVLRSAGSHGVFDLAAVRADETKFIQIKSTSSRKATFGSVIRELATVPRPPCCSVELWVWLKGQGWIGKHQIGVNPEGNHREPHPAHPAAAHQGRTGHPRCGHPRVA